MKEDIHYCNLNIYVYTVSKNNISIPFTDEQQSCDSESLNADKL